MTATHTPETSTTPAGRPARHTAARAGTTPSSRPPRQGRPRRRGAFAGTIARLAAVVALVGGLVVLPVAVWTLVGGPGAIDWRGLAQRGRVDADTVVALGLVVFTLLWIWFALVAVGEVVRVLAWRREPAATLPPIDPTPSGAIRRLVRVALVSTSTVVAASLSSLTGATGVGAAAPAPVVVHDEGGAMAARSVEHRAAATIADATPTSIRSSGRETPYSIAARLGDPGLRDRIIELNRGAVAPDGSTWTGGVFPAGMEVSVPAGLLGTQQITWQPYTVQEGDSVYRIATRLAAGDHLRVRDLADQIIERNLGRLMGDGKVFDDPSLIRIGWVIDVPSATGTPAGEAPASDSTSHVVQPGESYWSIAEQHATPPGDVAAVADLTDDLIHRNAPRLGHQVREMLHPGDRVELNTAPSDAVTAQVDAPVVVTPEATAPAVAPDRAASAGVAPDGATPESAVPVGAATDAAVSAAIVPDVVDPGAISPEATASDAIAPGPVAPGATAPDVAASDGVITVSSRPAHDPMGNDAGHDEIANDAAADDAAADDAAADDAAADDAASPDAASPDAAVDDAIADGASSGDGTVVDGAVSSDGAVPSDGSGETAAPTVGQATDPTAGATEPAASAATTDQVDQASTTRAPVTTSLAAAVLVCAGALGLAESRRRHQLRRAGVHARVPTPTPRAQRVERLVRSLDATQRAVRLDLALRSAGHLLVGTGGFVLAAIVADDGAVTLLLDRPGRLPGTPWTDGTTPDRWTLPADVTDDELAPTARLAGQPCPAVVHLGRVAVDAGHPAAGELFVDLEAFGLVCLDASDDVDASGADAVLRAIATSLAASPVGETLRLITHDVDTAVHLGNLNAEAADDIDTALDLAASALGSTPTAINGRRTAELRARGTGGEAWEPVVVVSGADDLPDTAVRELRDVTRGGGRGLAVVLRQPVDGASLTVRAERHGWVIERLGLTVVPVGIDLHHVHDVRHLLYTAEQPPLDAAITAPLPRTGEPFVEPEWSLMVRLLGGIDVVTGDGTPVPFDRGKSLELVVWLAQHREQSTRGGARAALWEMDVRDATFANIVSDARRSLAKATTPPDGEEWIARTLTDQLPLHPLVRTDAELLRTRLEHSRGRHPAEAVEILRPGVELIRDQPFAGTDYLWPDAEGITSALVQLATAASTELARHHLALGDVDGVFWATGRGLQALPGHEELIGLRMRAHHQCGDIAGVRHEWEAYERAMTADAWSDGEPSPKLLALRKELLQH